MDQWSFLTLPNKNDVIIGNKQIAKKRNYES